MGKGRWITRTLVTSVAALGLIGAACSKSNTSSGGGTPSPATSNPPATTTGAPSATTTLQQGANNQFVFTPAKLTVKQGATITVSNAGGVPHTFTVTGQSIDITNNRGQSQDVTINLPPGTYPFICRFHVNLGMKGTLIVK